MAASRRTGCLLTVRDGVAAKFTQAAYTCPRAPPHHKDYGIAMRFDPVSYTHLKTAVAALIDRLRDRLAQDVEPALEIVIVLDVGAAADEHLHDGGLGRLDGFSERGIVGRHVAPAQRCV